MKVFLLFILFLSSLVSCKQVTIPPKPEQYVGDYAKVLHPKEVATLDAILREYEKKTSYEVYVLVLPTCEANSMTSFCQDVFESWQIGLNNKRKGILIAFFIEEKKFHFEVSNELAIILTPSRIERIKREFMYPFLAKQEYYQSLERGIAALQIYIEEFGAEVLDGQMAQRLITK